jgi:hypothetical protein
MRGFRAAMTTVSTTWAAADHYRIERALKFTATIVATAAVVALASFVAVALSLTWRICSTLQAGAGANAAAQRALCFGDDRLQRPV